MLIDKARLVVTRSSNILSKNKYIIYFTIIINIKIKC